MLRACSGRRNLQESNASKRRKTNVELQSVTEVIMRAQSWPLLGSWWPPPEQSWPLLGSWWPSPAIFGQGGAICLLLSSTFIVHCLPPFSCSSATPVRLACAQGPVCGLLNLVHRYLADSGQPVTQRRETPEADATWSGNAENEAAEETPSSSAAYPEHC